MADSEQPTTSSTVAHFTDRDLGDAGSAEVRIIRSDHNPSDTGAPAVAQSGTTDAFGYLAIDSKLPYGNYTVLAKRGGAVSYMRDVTIDADFFGDGDTLRDTLREPGSITAVVKVQTGDDPRKVLILLMGTERLGAVDDTAGNFTLDGLAEGVYDARLMSLDDHYGVLDTSFTIVSGVDSVLSDTLVMPFTGIAPVTDLRVTYDSLWQVARLVWSAPDSLPEGGYNVYRSMGGATAVLVNPKPLESVSYADTLWFDSALVQGETYRYHVKGVGRVTTEESVPSNEVAVSTDPIYVKVGEFGRVQVGSGVLGSAGGMVAVGDRVYICDGENDRIVVVDTVGENPREFGADLDLDGPVDIAYDGNGALVVAEAPGNRITRIDTSGSITGRWGPAIAGLGTIANPYSIAIAGDSTIWFVATGVLYRLRPDSGLARKVGGIGPSSGEYTTAIAVACDHGVRAYLLDRGSMRIVVYDLGGTHVGSHPLPVTDPSALRWCSQSGHLLVATDRTGYVVGLSNDGVARWRQWVGMSVNRNEAVARGFWITDGDAVRRFLH